ncbi:helix-turn-helix domain-containing protein [Kitasatospora atroaurantiaca]|uniref:AraC-like DNA-binding protein n=1 Tax=Kitasatospora atroaurantiaca TaxID=285545 RepID=A0A561EM94_9ACTN|nr:AraC family transcriptional regulator [Kitasatospora atroaurantiaca]TWE16720.1 AraC-like DNA-binding protein [Kitasatospora atroaurantiaca]
MTVRKRHDSPREIADVAFAPPVGIPTGVEVMSLAELRERAAVRMARVGLRTPQRPTFHHLITISSGSLWHMVDFTSYALKPGSWLWVRPGQVQQWGDLHEAEGTLVLFERDVLDPGTVAAARVDDPHAPVLLVPDPEDGHALEMAVHHLALEFQALRGIALEAHVAVLRHLLAVLVLRLSQGTAAVGSPAPEPGETFVHFRDAVERDFARTRRLEDYARALGYSPRTLSRATLAGAGVGAKEFIDRRVVLEAKRLLAHGDQSASRIAAQLGFTSATNFSKYFHQRTGQSPIAFRATVRGHSSESGESGGGDGIGTG